MSSRTDAPWHRSREPAVELAKKVNASKKPEADRADGLLRRAPRIHTAGRRARRSPSRISPASWRVFALAPPKRDCRRDRDRRQHGTYNIDSETKGLTELQAGSFVFMDTLYRHVGGKQESGRLYRILARP